VPEPVRPPASHSSGGGGSRWIVVAVGIVAVAGLAWFLWNRQMTEKRSAALAGAASTRTAVVRTGDIAQSLRLTGSTSAEKYASLLVPQLRGSRGDGLRDGKTFSSPGANYNVTSNAGRSIGGGTIGAGPSSGGGDGSQLASTMGQSSGGSSALRSATSRVSSGARGGAGAMTSGSGGSGDSLGSTSNQLGGTGFAGGGSSGGGGGGSSRGGGGEFQLVLQSVAKSGGHVKKGEQVAEFDRVNMMNRLEDYHASVAQIDASFIKLKAEVEAQQRSRKQQLENAKAALDQARLDVKTIPVLSDIEAERVKLAEEEADAKYKQLVAEKKFADDSYASQIKVAQLELQQSHSELKRAELNADRMIMKAPIDGLVVMQSIFRGSEMGQVQMGDQLYSGMRFMQVVDPSSMIVNASVNQVDSDMVRVGQKAKVRFDAFPDLELPATVIALGAMTRPGNMRAAFVKEVPVILRIDRIDPRVIPDLSVSVDVDLSTEKQATVAPAAAVFDDDVRPGVKVAWVRQGDSWQKRQVQIGLNNNLEVVVKSGLQAGDVVALEPPLGGGGSGSSPSSGSKPAG